MKVEIREMPAMRIAAVHHTGPYHQIGKAFMKLGEIAGAAGLMQHAGTRMLAIYHDDPETTPGEQLQSDAGVTIPEDASLPAGLGEVRIPAGRYVSTVHIGPYEELPEIWPKLMGEWIPANGKKMRDGVSYELYHNNPSNTPKEKLETELFIPIE